MNQEQPTIGYDQFMPQPLQERLRIFNEISAENRALLIKSHVERWLAANRSRLNHEQVAILEEIIHSISPEWYNMEVRDEEKVLQEGEGLRKKAATIFSYEDMVQIMTNRADYIPAVEDKK